MTRVIVGIDPGLTGAMVATGALAFEMPFKHHTDVDVWLKLQEILEIVEHSNCGGDTIQITAYIEKQWARQNDARSNLAKLMFQYGTMHGMLVAAGIPFHTITPHKWQKALGVYATGQTGPEKKNKHKQLAQHLFAGRRVTKQTCDALLIAEFGRRDLQ